MVLKGSHKLKTRPFLGVRIMKKELPDPWRSGKKKLAPTSQAHKSAFKFGRVPQKRWPHLSVLVPVRPSRRGSARARKASARDATWSHPNAESLANFWTAGLLCSILSVWRELQYELEWGWNGSHTSPEIPHSFQPSFFSKLAVFPLGF